ncbi:methionine ABC transporter ATP-binding protein [Peptoniphilaceae bacterium SGI.131]
MIEIKNLSKTFNIDKAEVKAVKDVNLQINDGEIFGVIGYSGAGKSTLVRCINLLEKPTEGSVLIDGVDITQIDQIQLRFLRKKIGMIFQQFNLLSSLTVGQNIAFNLKGQKLSKKFIDKRVEELLDFIGISDKKDAYPSQLSGGQKQRVAIARALANNPTILLCDEATSALDPQTTKQILDLLKELNERLGITIVIITHEMQVIKSICDRVAVMENGNVVECGSVFEVFSNPKANITKDFIKSTNNLNQVKENLRLNDDLIKIGENQVLIKLDFVGQNTREAVIYEVAKKYDVSFNIAFGNMDLIQNQIIGSLIIILSGSKEGRENAILEFERRGIKVEVLK